MPMRPRTAGQRQPQSWNVGPRGTTAQRGYDAAHRRRREQVLREEPTCRYRYRGCTVQSTVCDHIVPRSQGGSDYRSNLAGCCRHCHAVKSQRESRA